MSNSAFEFSVSANDGQIGEIKPGVVFGAVVHLKPTKISNLRMLSSAAWSFLAARFDTGPSQAFNQRLRCRKTFQHGRAEFALSLGLGQVLNLFDQGIAHGAPVRKDLRDDHTTRAVAQTFDETARSIVGQDNYLRR